MIHPLRKALLCGLILLPISVAARPQTRGVACDTVAQVPLSRMQSIVDRFAYEFQACPDSMFTWAYRNTDSPDGKNKKVDSTGKDAIRLVYKDRTYDPQTHTGDVAIDIYVLGSRMYKDNHLVTIYSSDLEPGGASDVLTATYSGSLLENGVIAFRLDSVAPNKTRVRYNFDLTFGKFLSGFISDRTWSNVADWRFRRILSNLIEFAETNEVKAL